MSERDKLLEKIDIVDFISKYVDLTRSGSNYKGLSPFKEENTPSFVVSPTKKIFKDFSSNLGGDAIKFYSLIKKITYNKALSELAKEYGIKLHNNYEDENSIYYDLILKIKEHFSRNLQENKVALEYITKRQYDSFDIAKYGIGYANKSFNDLVSNFDNELLLKLGLISEKNGKLYDFFVDRLIFPIYNLNKKVVGFGARLISDDTNMPKYLNSQESIIFKKSNELFGIYDQGQKIKEYDAVILVEGFFDVLRLHKNSIVNTVASLGTNLTDYQAKTLSRLTKNVLIAYDNDKAGFDAKIRAINILNKYGFVIKVMSLDDMAKDPDEFIQKYGKELFVEKLNKSVDAFDFLYTYYTQDLDITKKASKMKIIENMREYFSTMSNKIYFDADLEKLAQKLEIKAENLRAHLKYTNNRIEYTNTKDVENNSITKKKTSNSKEELEQYTMVLLYYNKDLINDYKRFSYSAENEEIFNILLDENSKIREINNFEFLTDPKLKSKFFDILSKVDRNSINEDYKYRIYISWVFSYIQNSLDDILNLVYSSNMQNMPDEQYRKYMENSMKLKNLSKFKKIQEIREIFTQYLEYERQSKL